MADVTSGKGTALGKVIAQMCDDTVLQLAALATSETADAQLRYLRPHLSGLSSMLKRAPMPESLAGLSDAMQECNRAVNNIKTALSDNPTGWMSDRDQMAAHAQSLTDARNALSLRLNFEKT